MKKINQTGSAQLIVVVIAVIILLGVLGWVYYSNSNETDSDEKQVSNSEVKGSDPQDGTAPHDEMTISEYKVRGTYSLTGDSLSYKVQDDGLVSVFSKSLADNGCYGQVATIQVFEADETVFIDSDNPVVAEEFFESRTDEDWKKVNDKYYLYISPQNVCSDNTQKEEAEASDVVREYVLSLKEA